MRLFVFSSYSFGSNSLGSHNNTFESEVGVAIVGKFLVRDFLRENLSFVILEVIVILYLKLFATL